ncbi:MAG: type IV pilus assembly protein PilB [Alteromonadaceae bacterium]|jgi:type IV pilus assembly protein PilB
MPLSATSPLIRQLCVAGVIDEAGLKQGLLNNTSGYSTMPECLIAENFITAQALAEFCCNTFSTPLFDIDTLRTSRIPGDLITEKLMRKHQFVPLAKKSRKAFMGIADPTDFQALEDFVFNSSMQSQPIVVEHTKLQAVLESVFDANNDHLDISDLDVKEFGELELENTNELEDDNIAEKRLPQDGRIKLKISKKNPLIFVSAPCLPCGVKK